MKPEEFWNNTLKDNILFSQMQIANRLDNLKDRICLSEVLTDKLIQADAMSNKRPKIIRIVEQYKSLFKKEKKKQQTPEEQIAIFRALIKAEKSYWNKM